MRLCCRSHIDESGGLEVYLGILRQQANNETPEAGQRESPRVVKEAAGGLLALLEDDHTKLNVREDITALSVCVRDLHCFWCVQREGGAGARRSTVLESNYGEVQIRRHKIG
jgi:hypothetical protein